MALFEDLIGLYDWPFFYCPWCRADKRERSELELVALHILREYSERNTTLADLSDMMRRLRNAAQDARRDDAT